MGRKSLVRVVVLVVTIAMVGLTGTVPAAATNKGYCGHGWSSWVSHFPNYGTEYQSRFSYEYWEWWSVDQAWHHIHAYDEWRRNFGSTYIGTYYREC